MKRLALLLCAVVTCLAPFVRPGAVAAAQPNVPLSPGQRKLAPFHGNARFTTLPAQNVTTAAALAQSTAGTTIPLWSSSLRSFGKNFTFVMAGTTPLNNAAAQPSVIDMQFINFDITFADGTRLSSAASACGDSQSVVARTYLSPLLQNANYTSNGQYVGFTQFTDAFQRAAFWKTVQHSGYHVLLVPGSDTVYGITVSVKVPASKGSILTFSPSGCALGGIDLTWFDGVEQSIVKSLFHRTDRLPLSLTYNTVFYQGTTSNCCVLGYHSAFGTTAGTQTYSVGAYFDQGIFSGTQGDVSALSHELGEWLDDPLVNNATPAWGHTGQVSGCQSNLENGDPLSGKIFNVNMNGFTYHVQELAFPSWFYRQSPSTGTAGKDSFLGTFTSGQPTICH